MSARRRSLWATATVCLVAWALVVGVGSPAVDAVAQTSADALPVVASAAGSASVLVRPLALLRRPGETGLIIAHRGDSSSAPENTLPAFAASIAAGAEFFEIDIRLSQDGVPVVIHDSTVDRTTDGTGAVAELTLDELRALDAGSWFDEAFAGTRIPTLGEALALAADGGSRILIEYKGSWSRAGVRATVDMIAAAGLENRVVVQSFGEKTVAKLAEAAPDIPVGWLVDVLDASAVATARKIGADAVNPAAVTAEGVAQAHHAQLGVVVWTRDADADWESLTAMGVDGIVTNRPAALQSWRDDRGRAEKKAPGWSPEPSSTA